jgi:hypothetical protein
MKSEGTASKRKNKNCEKKGNAHKIHLEEELKGWETK